MYGLPTLEGVPKDVLQQKILRGALGPPEMLQTYGEFLRRTPNAWTESDTSGERMLMKHKPEVQLTHAIYSTSSQLKGDVTQFLQSTDYRPRLYEATRIDPEA